MADISKVDSLDGLTTYNVKDAAARALLDGHSVGKDVPSDAKFTDTTYSSKSAASGGTDVSLVTTGEKYNWNNKGSYSKPSGGIPDSDIASASTWNAKGTYSKPSGGIPKTDLASSVQTSLGKADTALQSHQTIKQDGVTGATVNRFGTCSTAAGTAAKAVSITTGTFSLEAGAMVAVKFSKANTASTPTLNVNSSGAKNIFVKGAQITTGGNKALLAGTVIFLYDGTQWHLIGNYYDTNTTYSVATTSANGLMSAADKTKLDAVGGIIISDTEPTSLEPLIWIDTDDDTSDVIPTSAGDLGLASFVGITLTTIKTIVVNE